MLTKNCKIIIFVLCLLPSLMGWAQYRYYSPYNNPTYNNVSAADSTERLQVHGQVMAGIASGWGEVHSYTAINPTIRYQLNDKWTLKAGFAVVNDIDIATRQQPRSLAPRKNSSTAAAVAVGTEYQHNNLLFSASAFYLGGQTDPLWSNTPYNLEAYGVSATMHYRLNDNNYLSLHVGLFYDNNGALGRMMWDNPYYYGWGQPFSYGYGWPMGIGQGFAGYGF